MASKRLPKQSGSSQASAPLASPTKELLAPPARAAGAELIPLAQDAGQTLTRAGKLILAPFRGLIWGGEQIVQFIEEKIEARLKEIPEESIVSPDPQVTGPALEALRYCGSKEEIAELFANLISKSMIKEEKNKVHPSFVEIIKQLTISEALFIKQSNIENGIAIANIKLKLNIGGYRIVANNIISDYQDIFLKHQEYSNVAMTNLFRLGLIEITYRSFLQREGAYAHIENGIDVKSQREKYKDTGIIDIQKGIADMTPYGRLFLSIIRDKPISRKS